MRNAHNLADPTFEPSDEQWTELMRSAFSKVMDQRRKADALMWANIEKMSQETLEKHRRTKAAAP